MNKLEKFVIWLDGVLQASDSSLNEHQTNLIKNKLNNLFEHEAETLNDNIKININPHDAATTANPNQLYRC